MGNSYLDGIQALAQRGYEQYGINPVLTMSQAILESGNGTSGLAKTYNNQFGIKSSPNWEKNGGKVTTMRTTEESNGQKTKINAGFRWYDNIAQSFEDYFKLLSGSNYYKGVVGVKDWNKAIDIIDESPYATDSQYGNKLKSIVKKYGLDTIGQKIMNGQGIYSSSDNLTTIDLTGKTQQEKSKVLITALATVLGITIILS